MNEVMKYKKRATSKKKKKLHKEVDESLNTSLTVDALVCLGMTEPEVVKFIVKKPGSQQGVADRSLLHPPTFSAISVWTAPSIQQFLKRQKLSTTWRLVRRTPGLQKEREAWCKAQMGILQARQWSQWSLYCMVCRHGRKSSMSWIPATSEK